MGIPSDKYDELVDDLTPVIHGYTAPAYDLVLAVEQAFIMAGLQDKKERDEIKKERDAFLKNMEMYIKQRIKLDLQI